MATQMQLGVILAGSPIATRALHNLRVNKDESGKQKLFLYPCFLEYYA